MTAVDPKAIMRADAKRRAMRRKAEDNIVEAIYAKRNPAFTTPHPSDNIDPYLYSRWIYGVPSNKQRNVRYAEAWRPSQKTAQPSYDTTKARLKKAVAAAKATPANIPHRMTAADLPPIGDSNH